MPLIMFPLVLASLSDAIVAITRISKFLTAEELGKPYAIDFERKFAVDADGDFTWETSSKPVDVGHKSAKGGGAPRADGAKKPKQKADPKNNAARRGLFRDKSAKAGPVLPTTTTDGTTVEKGAEQNAADETPFELKNLKLQIPKGSFVAIVGRVGSGKVANTLAPSGSILIDNPFCNYLELAFTGPDRRDAKDEG
jgi:ATP-binding cassette, subfamily C (CFTR/MRP), member 1